MLRACATMMECVLMTLSVLVVDDSAMARKMLRRALPSDWDIEVNEVSGGAEAPVACGDLQRTR